MLLREIVARKKYHASGIDFEKIFNTARIFFKNVLGDNSGYSILNMKNTANIMCYSSNRKFI